MFDVNVELISHQVEDLSRFACIVLPGGFSYGDYLRPGALAKQTNVAKAIQVEAEAGKLVLGISNGFQVLIELGLLPGMMMPNESLKFICKQVNVKVNQADTLFTSEYEKDEVITLPIAHEQGNYDCDETTLQQLLINNQIVFTYEDSNPNGSKENIAGIINEKGNVLGVMVHPERAVEALLGSVDGYKLFQSMIKNLEGNRCR